MVPVHSAVKQYYMYLGLRYILYRNVFNRACMLHDCLDIGDYLVMFLFSL